MAFDLATAKPVEAGGFDIATAKPAAGGAMSAFESGIRKAYGAKEALSTLATGATTALVGRVGGTLGGIAASVATGKYGTHEGADLAELAAHEGAQKYTYEPKTEEGREILEKLGRAFHESKLGGLGPSESILLGNALPRLGQVPQGVRKTVSDLGREADLPKAISGAVEESNLGRLGSPAADARRQAAESLPVPIKLMKGQATRDFEQLRFEKETAKDPRLGPPIRERIEDQNQKILQNFDAWVDQTGAQAGSVRATGETVTKAVAEKADKAKADIRFAYEKARRTGDMAEQVPVGDLLKYVEDHAAEAVNAPVITSTGMKLEKLAKNGSMSINDLEEVRKMVGALAGKDATNAHFGKEIKAVIDGLTEGKGGEAYKAARALRARYAEEFENHAVIDRLLSFKPGTQDRAVAFEDVFQKSILSGSLDDVRTLRKVLQTGGANGQQAWRELQGATLKHIKDEITKGVATDSAGQRVVSPAQLNKIVTELDKDGKLDFIFGRQGAQQIRDINGLSIDAFTAPPGVINTSNTGSVIAAALDKIASKVTGVPFLGSAANYAAKEVKEAAKRKQVQEALK